MSPNTQQTSVRRRISIQKLPPKTQDPIDKSPPNTQQTTTVRRWISISELEAQDVLQYSWNSRETTGDRYEFIKDIGSVIKLMRDRQTNETVAIKFLQRGNKIDNNDVLREIINHRSLRHPNILRFREVILTQTHLGIVMDYASGGALIDFINQNQKLLNEDEARNIFQQLIDGVGYCHSMQICHGELKPENILFDGSSTPTLKISDFGYSKFALLDCEPKSFGTCQYTAPEVFHRKKYNGKMADVWSCGVILYVMLFCAYPFEDTEDPTNSVKIMRRILDVNYFIPEDVQISEECRHLISRIFVADPTQRITIQEIQKHAWFRKNLPQCPMDQSNVVDNQFQEPVQSIEEITKMIEDATYRFLARIGS